MNLEAAVILGFRIVLHTSDLASLWLLTQADMQLQAKGDLTVPHTKKSETTKRKSRASTQILTLIEIEFTRNSIARQG